jgi:DNA-binding HxlR family transcriptional regulator
VCPLESAIRVIGGKWKIPLICALANDGATRYNVLKRKIYGITNTMLANSLRELEESELVERKQFMEVPVRVEYSITAKGRALIPILLPLLEWGRQVSPGGKDR